VVTSENLVCRIMKGLCGKIGPPASSLLKQYHFLVVEVFLFHGWLAEYVVKRRRQRSVRLRFFVTEAAVFYCAVSSLLSHAWRRAGMK